jgi:hypothetical protein
VTEPAGEARPSDVSDELPVDDEDGFEALEADDRTAFALPSWLSGPAVWEPNRPTWATAVAAIFLLTTISQVLYAGMIPLLPPILPDPVPWFGFVVGAVSLAAGFAIYRGLEWGRWLGIALAVTWLARTLAVVEPALRSPALPDGPDVWLDVVIPIGLNAAILLLLLIRWPRRSSGVD